MKKQFKVFAIGLSCGIVIVAFFFLITFKLEVIPPNSKDYDITKDELTFLPEQTREKQTEVFMSDDLGFSFNYLPFSDTDQLYEEYDRVCFESCAQMIQVFPKKKWESLVEAVESHLLAGKSHDSCWAEESDMGYRGVKYSGKVYTAHISFPGSLDVNETEHWQNAKKCGPFSSENDGGYFYYDENYPNRYYYFVLGQEFRSSGLVNEETGQSLGWNETFNILK